MTVLPVTPSAPGSAAKAAAGISMVLMDAANTALNTFLLSNMIFLFRLFSPFGKTARSHISANKNKWRSPTAHSQKFIP
jgi:hypothetical protein